MQLYSQYLKLGVEGPKAACLGEKDYTTTVQYISLECNDQFLIRSTLPVRCGSINIEVMIHMIQKPYYLVRQRIPEGKREILLTLLFRKCLLNKM